MTSRPPSKAVRWAPIVLFVATLACVLVCFDPRLSTWGDNARYVVLAESIATGQGFREISHPDAPVNTWAPLGLPLMLVPFTRLPDHGIVEAKLMVGLLFALVAPLLFWGLRRRWGALCAGAVVVLTATNASLLAHSHQLMTEVPYLLFTVLAVALAIKWLSRDDPSTREQIGWALAVTCACMCALLIRSGGLALIGALILVFLSRRKWVAVGLLAASTVLVRTLAAAWKGAPEGALVNSIRLADPYNPELGTLSWFQVAERWFENVWVYATDLTPAALFPGNPGVLLSVVVLVPIVVGFIVELRRFGPISVYLVATFGLLGIWPQVWRVERMLVPLVPFLWLCFFSGVTWLASHFKDKPRAPGRRILQIVAVVLVMSVLAWNFFSAVAHSRRVIPRWEHFFAVLEWAEENTPADSVLMTRKPSLTYLVSGRRAVRIPATTDPDGFYEVVHDTGVTHVVFDTLGLGQTNDFLVPRLMEAPGLYRVLILTESPPMGLYQYMGAPAPPAGSD